MSTQQTGQTRNVGEREARQVAEEARETGWQKPSFGKQLFLGDFRLDLIHPHPRPDAEAARRGEEFCARMREFCETSVDGALIEREARIPDEVVKGLAAIGAFGMKIAPEYGGLGLTNLYYNRALIIAGSASPVLAALLSAHQSIGVPQPLALFGTEEQKQRYLPRCARGEISAFLLTEPDVGSDPARLSTTATPSAGRVGVRAGRREAVDHERGGRRPAGGDGPGAEERRAPRRDHRVRGGGQRARDHRRAAERVHGPARPGERGDQVPRGRVPADEP